MEEYRDLRLTLGAFHAACSARGEFVGLDGRASCCRRTCPSPTRRSRSSSPGPASRHARRRRRDQGPPRQGRQPRDGARRGASSTAGRRPPTRRRPTSTPATCDCSTSRCAPRARRRAARRGREPQPLRRGLGRSSVAERRGVAGQLDVEMLEGMANAEADGARPRRAARPALRAGHAPRRLRLGGRLPRAPPRREHRRRRTTCARPSTSRDSPATFEEQRGRFLASVRERHAVSLADAPSPRRRRLAAGRRALSQRARRRPHGARPYVDGGARRPSPSS